MAVAATRDTLSITSALLDKSDAIFEETQRLVKAAEARRATADLADVHAMIPRAHDLAALLLSQWTADIGGGRSALDTCLAECTEGWVVSVGARRVPGWLPSGCSLWGVCCSGHTEDHRGDGCVRKATQSGHAPWNADTFMRGGSCVD